MQTNEFLEGSRLEGEERKKETGKKKGEEIWPLYMNRSLKKKKSQHQFHRMYQQLPYTCVKTIN